MDKTINDMVREVAEGEGESLQERANRTNPYLLNNNREGERKRSDGYTQHPCIKCNEDTLVWQNTVSDWICESCGEWEGGD